MVSDITQVGTITASGQTVQITTTDMSTVGLQLSGTWTGTLVPELSVDGVNWTLTTLVVVTSGAIVSSVTANGTWQGNSAACLAFRVRASAAITGTVIVNFNATASASLIMADNPLAVVVQGGSAVIGHVITDAGSVSAVSGTAAAGSAASGNPVQVGAVYNTSAPTPTNGQIEPLQSDSLGNLQSNLYTKIAGEDLTDDVMKVEGQFSYQNITTTTTTTIKSGAGLLHSLTINKPVASSVITIYDNTAGSGTTIGTITLPATLLQEGPYTALYDVKYATGLTIVTATGASDITVSYR